MPKGYLIGHVTVHDPDLYAEYVARNTALMARHGGMFRVRGGQGETPEGASHDRHVVIEFPSYAAARSAYADPEYQIIADIRKRSADSVIILVEGT